MDIVIVARETEAAPERETPESYYRGRAAYLREHGFHHAADFMDRLADDCKAEAAQRQIIADDIIPF